MSSNYHPTTRVLALLALLQAHGQLSGAELSTQLGIDRRSLRRYIVTLEEIGIPIVTERGRHGGYALMPGFKLPPMMFSDDEAFALMMGLIALRQMNLVDIAQASASAAAKLQRLLPDGLKSRLSAAESVIQLDLRVASVPANKELLATLSKSVMQRQKVHLKYKGIEGKDSARDIDPYGLVFHIGNWYLVGMCHLRKGIRSFRLDRIVSVQALQQQFVEPTGFNALHYLQQSLAVIPRAYSVEVLLKTDIQTASAQIPDALATLEQTLHGVLLHNQSDDLSWFARQLASLPFEFEIHKPAALRKELASLGRKLTAVTANK